MNTNLISVMAHFLIKATQQDFPISLPIHFDQLKMHKEAFCKVVGIIAFYECADFNSVCYVYISYIKQLIKQLVFCVLKLHLVVDGC